MPRLRFLLPNCTTMSTRSIMHIEWWFRDTCKSTLRQSPLDSQHVCSDLLIWWVPCTFSFSCGASANIQLKIIRRATFLASISVQMAAIAVTTTPPAVLTNKASSSTVTVSSLHARTRRPQWPARPQRPARPLLVQIPPLWRFQHRQWPRKLQSCQLFPLPQLLSRTSISQRQAK